MRMQVSPTCPPESLEDGTDRSLQTQRTPSLQGILLILQGYTPNRCGQQFTGNAAEKPTAAGIVRQGWFC